MSAMTADGAGYERRGGRYRAGHGFRKAAELSRLAVPVVCNRRRIRAMSFTTSPLSPVFGIEITGLDLSKDPDDPTFSALYDAWVASGGILIVRDQQLSVAQHVAFSRRFGPIYDDPDTERVSNTVIRYLHPDRPQIYRVSNITDSKGAPLGRRRAGTYWHSDVSYLARPARA